jgi:hypothetical protein
MATRSRTSFQKRQKEIARMERQRDKAARRQQRKLAPKETGEYEPDVESPDAELGARQAASGDGTSTAAE